MLTRRATFDLLHHLSPGTPLERLAHALGFTAAPVALGDTLARALGTTESRSPARLLVGRGVLRALLVECPAQEAIRPFVSRMAARLSARAPHQLWLLLTARGARGPAAVAAWHADRLRPRVSALVLDPARVLDSDVETVLALAAAADGQEALVHARWCEIMGRDALSHRFYRALEGAILALGEGALGKAPSEARRELAILASSRLLFLSFLQSRGWLDGDADFLVRRVDAALATGGDVHRRLLEPLFFGTLNTPASRRAPAARAFGRVPFLNGGLFSRSPLERRYRGLRFRDDEVGTLFDHVLTRYRFTTREEQADWSEAAIDPEMLGRAFESLMASRERRDSGAYYTPHALVARVTEAALEQALESPSTPRIAREWLADPSSLTAREMSHVRNTLAEVRVLDPACGSGAFLVHALERITQLCCACGDPRPRAAIRRAVLTRSIFGVDVNPVAVWLCELRLWLSSILDLETDDPAAVPPLPNLDRNVRVGDTLASGVFAVAGATRARDVAAGRGSIAALRDRYARATGHRKQLLARRLDDAERRAALADIDRRIDGARQERHELLLTARGRDLFGGRRGALGGERARRDALRVRLRSLRASRLALERGAAPPFSFASHFADAAAGGGFDIVLGNPPWVRLHRIAADRREALRAEFRVFRDAAWKRGAAGAGAGAGFAAQVDLAALFAERSVALTRPGGTLALLLPIKLWRSLAGGGVRQLFTDHLELNVLEDWSEAPAAFDASVYPSLVVARTRGRVPASSGDDVLHVAVHRRDLAVTWSMPRPSLPLDASPGAPWLLLPPPARAAFARLAAAGPPLADSGLGRPILVVKCGLNSAFVVRRSGRSAEGTCVESADRTGCVEDSMLRPVLRGEHARRWLPSPADEHLIWTHGVNSRALAALPPLTARWLARWRAALSRRSDLRPGAPWWSLHRLEGAANDRPRVVWADMSRGPRASVLPSGSRVIPLNTCYVLRCRDDEDAAALAALLNSPLAAGWLDAVAEPARGGFRRYLGWTVARLPIPADWARARGILSPLGARG
ncbi:MAG: DNA methyltransferase, partial [Gemmatimonadaceae bacterium]